MTKAILVLNNVSRYANARIMNFTYSNEFGCHVYQEKAFTPEEFNEISDKVIDDARAFGYDPHVRLVEVEDSKPEPVKKKTKKAAKKKAAKPKGEDKE